MKADPTSAITSPSDRHRLRLAGLAATLLLAAGCAITPGGPRDTLPPDEARALVGRLLPAATADRAGWAADVVSALDKLEVPITAANLCAVMAVTEQESTYRADPSVPNLPKIAREEIASRAERTGIPQFAVRAALQLRSSDGRSYDERLDTVKTERELSELYEDLIDQVPLGRSFLASRNPVRTGGPMQVAIAFAEDHARRKAYPYPLDGSIRREVFTRRGGLYFGTAHLLAYEAPYPELLYRYADFNAGQYASRNAAFQNAAAVASGRKLTLDGDLLPPDLGPDAPPGETEGAVLRLDDRLNLGAATIRRELGRADAPDFHEGSLWRRVFEIADARAGRALPRAVVPQIRLSSPKITRQLTTEWFARRVDERQKRCIGRATAPAEG